MIKDDTPVYAFEIPDMRLSEEFFYALGHHMTISFLILQSVHF